MRVFGAGILCETFFPDRFVNMYFLVIVFLSGTSFLCIFSKFTKIESQCCMYVVEDISVYDTLIIVICMNGERVVYE